MKKKMTLSEAWRYYLKEFMDERGYTMDDFAVMDLQTIVMSVAAAVIGLVVIVMILGNLDTAISGTVITTNTTDVANSSLSYVYNTTGSVVDQNSTYFPLLATVSGYGVVAVTLLAIGIIVAGAAAILYIIRGSF